MDRTFPKELVFYAKSNAVKKAFVSDASPTNPHDCQNCGGNEVLTLFCAIKGPFESPGMPGMREGEHYLTSHWDDNCGYGGRGGWWVGVTYTFPCPVCLGDQPQKPLREYPVQNEMNGMIHPHTGERLEGFE